MIHSLLVDEVRAHLAEDIARGQAKRPPDSAEDRVDKMLARASKPQRGQRAPGMLSLGEAQRIMRDAEEYDRKAARGDVEG